MNRAILILAILAALIRPAVGQEASASVSRERVYVGNEITFTINITESPAATIPEVDFPPNVRASFMNSGQQSTTSTRIINGRRERVMESTYTYQYQVLVREPGTITIPAATIKLRSGETVTTRPVRFEALLPQPAPNFEIRITAPRDTVYVGETFTATVEWVMPESVRNANFDSSQFPSDLDILPSTQPRNRVGQLINFNFLGRETVGSIEEIFTPSGSRETVFRFELLVTPDRPGPTVLGPIRVVFDRAAPGAGYTRVYTESEPLRLNALPLPTENRPAGFTGLIGSYRLNTTASTTEANVGDPITFQAELLGAEPMVGADRLPPLETAPGFADSFRFSPDGWNARRSSEPDERVFTTTIRALTAEATEIPPIVLYAFDPTLGAYTEVRSDPIPINIRSVREATLADAVVAPGRANTRIDRPTLEPTDPAFWAAPTSEQIAADRPFEVNVALRHPATITTIAAAPAMVVASAGILAFRRRRQNPTHRRDRALREAEHLAVRRSPADAARHAAAVTLGCEPEAVTLADIAHLPAHPGVRRTLAEAFAPAESPGASPSITPADTRLAIRTLRSSLRKAEAAR